MWYVNYLIFLGLGILFLYLSIEWQKNPFWHIVSIVLDAVLWFILALSSMQLDFPYTFLDSTDVVVTGYYQYTDPLSPFFAYIFLLLACLMMVYLIATVYDKYLNMKF